MLPKGSDSRPWGEQLHALSTKPTRVQLRLAWKLNVFSWQAMFQPSLARLFFSSYLFLSERGMSWSKFSSYKSLPNSATGNWTRVFRVTGGNTNHYTIADLAYMASYDILSKAASYVWSCAFFEFRSSKQKQRKWDRCQLNEFSGFALFVFHLKPRWPIGHMRHPTLFSCTHCIILFLHGKLLVNKLEWAHLLWKFACLAIIASDGRRANAHGYWKVVRTTQREVMPASTVTYGSEIS